MFRYLGLWMCLSIGVAGCAGRGMMSKDENPATPKPDRAVVTLMFPRATSDLLSVSVYDVTEPQTKFIGILENGSKIAYPVPAGKYTFMIVANSTDFLEAQVAGGKTYYAVVEQVQPHAAGFLFRYAFRAVRAAEIDSADFRAVNRDTPFRAKTERADAWYGTSESSVRNRREAYLPAWRAKTATARSAQMLNVEDGR
jgi:hypothetical protein